jgi:hypothetical protein
MSFIQKLNNLNNTSIPKGNIFSRVGDKLFIKRPSDNTAIPFKGLGFNDNLGSWSHTVGSAYANITNMDNPVTTEFFSQLLGKDNASNTNTQALNCNLVRAYLPYSGTAVLDSANLPTKLITKTYTSTELRDYYVTMKKNGIHTMFNSFKAFAPYNSGGYASSQAERKRQFNWWNEEEKTSIFRELAKLAEATGEDQVLFALGNESNLDYTLKGVDYSTLSPTYSQDIYWADPANPLSRSANLTAMFNWYNNLASLIKFKYKNKFCIGVVLQYADSTQATEIETAMNAGLLSNLDWIGNNYYGIGSVTNPEINPASVNVFSRYKANVSSTYRLPMILTETGPTNKIYLVPNALASYGDKKPLPLDPSIITYDYSTEQGQIITNLANTLLNNASYDYVAGIVNFPFFSQNGRDATYDYAAYTGFNFPKPATISGQPSYNPANYTTYYNEKDFYNFNFPDKDLVNLNNDYTNIPTTVSTINARKTSVYNSLRSSFATNHTNLTYNQ